MTKIEIEKINLKVAPKIKGIYAIISESNVYIGKSTNLFSRLKCHKSSNYLVSDKSSMYILDAYKDISNLDLMVMEDYYICKFEALGYELTNTNDALPKRIRGLLMGKKKYIKLYKQFSECEMESRIFNLEIKTTRSGQKRVFLVK